MPFIVHTDKIEGFESFGLFEDERRGGTYYTPVSEAIIFGTMPLGIGDLHTEADALVYWERIRTWERIFGAFVVSFNDDDTRTDRPITAADVYRHIGLRTNVSRETDAKFWARIRANARRDSKEEWQRMLAEAKAQASEPAPVA